MIKYPTESNRKEEGFSSAWQGGREGMVAGVKAAGHTASTVRVSRQCGMSTYVQFAFPLSLQSRTPAHDIVLPTFSAYLSISNNII